MHCPQVSTPVSLSVPFRLPPANCVQQSPELELLDEDDELELLDDDELLDDELDEDDELLSSQQIQQAPESDTELQTNVTPGAWSMVLDVTTSFQIAPFCGSGQSTLLTIRDSTNLNDAGT